jgi:site-specific recombinase XerD
MSSDLGGCRCAGVCTGAFEPYVASFARERGLKGPADHWKASVNRREVAAFAQWAERRGIPPVEVSDAHVAEFFACAASASSALEVRRRRAIALFLEHMRRIGVSRSAGEPADATPAGVVLRKYVRHLRGDRGFADRSVAVYLPYVRQFVADCVLRSGVDLDSEAVRTYFLDRVHKRPLAYTCLVAAALRSFLRFLFFRGATSTDLARAIPRVQRWRLAPVHAFLSPEDVDRVLRRTDRTTPTGRRDYAILLLLARLGLRGGEVAALELGDVRWRKAEVAVRGKGGVVRVLPLPADAGRAMARYVRSDRPRSVSRRLFLRRIPPYVGLSGPATVGHVVRYALMRAGLHDPSRRGASHLFRHGLATCMVRQGATIPEIAEILGHRSIGTTQIYAKVDFETLRGVALPWPRGGGR